VFADLPHRWLNRYSKAQCSKLGFHYKLENDKLEYSQDLPLGSDLQELVGEFDLRI
jgi:hypothetical protein